MMPDYHDFQEIAHSGGTVTFRIHSDAEGRVGYATRYQFGGPGPGAITGLYVHLQTATPVMFFRMGGIGQAWEPPMPDGCAPVFLGSDTQQCWGHQCPTCQTYFRSGSNPIEHPMTCPYCGWRNHSSNFVTPAQRRYCAHWVERLITGLHEERPPGSEWIVELDMDAVADETTGEKPAFYYSEEAQQTNFRCHKCNEFNDIRGRFGYCSSCGWRNNQPAFRATMDALRDQLRVNHITPEQAVRTSVSEFDSCSRDYVGHIVRRTAMKPGRREEMQRQFFHDPGRRIMTMLTERHDINLLQGMEGELDFLRLMMCRRHIFEHNGGVVDQLYLDQSGDGGARLGALVRENVGNLHRLVGLLNRMVENFDRDFHEIFRPTEAPIQSYEAHKRHIAQLRGQPA